EGEYEAEESCLSLSGKRKAVRYTTVKVKYRDERFKTQVKSFSGFTAQIIQHEMDHLEGILI
ncbi:MAG: peptide deformylase, partial [Clostridia bacterium]|nr:peptide deformylase [Clostridia bacterium]